ncbi:hypothetical protein C5167_046759, partial [Papaver somniferum]
MGLEFETTVDSVIVVGSGGGGWRTLSRISLTSYTSLDLANLFGGQTSHVHIEFSIGVGRMVVGGAVGI